MVGSMEETFQLVLEGKEALVLFIIKNEDY